MIYEIKCIFDPVIVNPEIQGGEICVVNGHKIQ